MIRNGGGNHMCSVRKAERESTYRDTASGRARMRRYRLREACKARNIRVEEAITK